MRSGSIGKKIKTLMWKGTCTTMFTTALFITAKTWKQPKCPSTGEWTKKMWSIYTMEDYSAIKNFAVCNQHGLGLQY